MTLGSQIIWLFVMAIPIACISWSVTHEELFREMRDFCTTRSKKSKSLVARKLFYILTCEYCFSHYVTIVFLLLTRYTLLFTDWRGYVISGFSLVWIANLYMSVFGFLRVDLKAERLDIELKEKRK